MGKRKILADQIRSVLGASGAKTVTIKMSADAATRLAHDLGA